MYFVIDFVHRHVYAHAYSLLVGAGHLLVALLQRQRQLAARSRLAHTLQARHKDYLAHQNISYNMNLKQTLPVPALDQVTVRHRHEIDITILSQWTQDKSF